MRTRFVIVAGLLTGAMLATAFAPKPALPQDGVKQAELAKLMRQMMDEATRSKAQVTAGKKPGRYPARFDKIHTATPSDPAVKTETFKVFADDYLAKAKAFHASGEAKAYNLMVASCANCHATYCPGPLKRIRALNVPE
jgi:hypothetical protein